MKEGKKAYSHAAYYAGAIFVLMLILGTIAFFQWELAFKEQAEKQATIVEEGVEENSQVLIDILREDINAVEAELACREKGGSWINGACISVVNSS